MGFFDFLKPRDPLESKACMIVGSAVKWARKYPGRPIHECMTPRLLQFMRMLMPEASVERRSLESIAEADPPITDLREYCCALMEVLTGITPDHPEDYARVIEVVDRELDRHGVLEA